MPRAQPGGRWIWDLRYAAPVSTTRGYPISAVPHATPREPLGPLALPGSYRVRLTVDGRHFEAPLTVKADPRVPASAQDLAGQLRLATQLAELLTGSSRTLLAAQSEQAQLKALAPLGATADAVHAWQARLARLLEKEEEKEASTAPGGSPPRALLPDVQEHISGLYTELARADAAPTAAQLSATDTAQREFNSLLDEWQKLQADLPALNTRLQEAKLAPVRADLAPPRDVNVADED